MTETPRKIIHYPLLSEKAMDSIERENKLIFIVNKKASKKEIKEAFEELYEVKVKKINTINTMKGNKKALIQLTPEYNAMELATDLQLL